MAGQWANLSVQKCADVSAILRRLKNAGATLPAEISPMGGPLLDLAETVVGDDSIWSQLPDSFRFEDNGSAATRQILRVLVRESK